MKLSENFSLAELTISDTAKRNGIKNIPNNKQIESLKKLAVSILHPVRNHFGVPIHVSSGFRSKELNKFVKGAQTSQHCAGEAVDIDMDNTSVTNRQIFDFIRLNLEFDQLIYEFGTSKNPDWVHVSFVANLNQRNQILIAKKIDGKTIYQKF